MDNSQIEFNVKRGTSMIDIKTLKELVLEVFAANPYTPVAEIIPDVERLADYHGIFPSSNECRWIDIYLNYYDKKRLSPIDRVNVNQIIWELIRENLLVIEKERLN